MGSPAAAALIAKIAFVILIALGLARGDLTYRSTAVFLCLGALAVLGLPLLPFGAPLVTSAIAILDIALVLTVFKGDVRFS
jgi:hypothetical protein